MVKLATIREKFSAFETFGFPGHAVPGREFVGAIARAAGQNLEIKAMSWWLIHTVGQLVAMGRELSEIGYLWKIPHRIAGDKLKAAIGDVPHTPLDAAVARALKELGVTA
jgi:hypothetical protein